MSKIHFFQANGTSNLLSFFGAPVVGINLGTETKTIKGLNGQSAQWDGNAATDPFPSFLNPDAWEVKVVGYPAAIFPANASIDFGVTQLSKLITDLPAGTPFCLGGFSQGGAVCSKVLTLLQAGTLGAGRLADMKAAVMFGNPCRKTDWKWPAFGGYAGGLESGSWDVAGSTTGGHGAFPASMRLTNPPERWFEFGGGRVHKVDPICGTGDSNAGQAVTTFAGNVFSFPFASVIGAVLNTTTRNAILALLDAAGGHGAYGTEPPPGYAANAPTSYQIALEYLESIAAAEAVAPILLPPEPTSALTSGWSTSLIPPAA